MCCSRLWLGGGRFVGGVGVLLGGRLVVRRRLGGLGVDGRSLVYQGLPPEMRAGWDVSDRRMSGGDFYLFVGEMRADGGLGHAMSLIRQMRGADEHYACAAVLWRSHACSLAHSLVPPSLLFRFPLFHLRACTHKSPTITNSTASCFLSHHLGAFGVTRVHLSFSYPSHHVST